jgi:hypothetical protein
MMERDWQIILSAFPHALTDRRKGQLNKMFIVLLWAI